MRPEHDDPLDDALATRPPTDRESRALAHAQEFIRRQDFALQLRPTPFWLELCAGLGVALLVVSLVILVARNHAPIVTPASAPTVSPAAASSSAVSSPMTGPGSAAALAKDRWTQLPAAPIAGRVNAAAVWDGREMLVWGGAEGPQQAPLLADGASYDPAAQRWALLPPSPLGPRDSMAYVWTGQYLFIWGGYDAITPSSAHAAGDGALYDPRARSWRRLPAGPLPAESSAQAVWTGSEVVLLGGQTTGPGGGLSSAVAAYVPATNTWRSLPPIPQSVSGNAASLTAVAAGSEIYVWEEWAHFQQNGNESTTTSGLEPIRYDQASNQWRTQPTTGTGPPFVVPQALWTGTEILVPATYQCPFGASCPASGGNSFVGYRWSPATTAWATIPHGPVDGLHAGSLWTGAALLDYNSTDTGGPDNSVEGEAAAWDPASNAWTRLPNAPYAGGLVAVWTGDRLLMWGEMAPPRPNAAATSGPYQAVGLQFGP